MFVPVLNAPTQRPGHTIRVLGEVVDILKELPENIPAKIIKLNLSRITDQISKENGGRGSVLWPLRYALSGQEQSPDPFTLIDILGRNESVTRIQRAIKVLQS